MYFLNRKVPTYSLVAIRGEHACSLHMQCRVKRDRRPERAPLIPLPLFPFFLMLMNMPQHPPGLHWSGRDTWPKGRIIIANSTRNINLLVSTEMYFDTADNQNKRVRVI